MNKQEKIHISIFLLLWTTIVFILFLHTSGKADFKFLHFNQASGNLVMAEEGYKTFNILGLRDEVYAIPHGAPFVHPKRRSKMKRKGIFEAASLEEAHRMIDAGTEDINDNLTLIEKRYLGFNIYTRRNKYIGVPSQGEPNQYRERFVGNSLDKAKENITSIWKSRQ